MEAVARLPRERRATVDSGPAALMTRPGSGVGAAFGQPGLRFHPRRETVMVWFNDEPRDTSTAALRYRLERDGELVLSAIAPCDAPTMVKRVKGIVRAMSLRIEVSYDEFSRKLVAR